MVFISLGTKAMGATMAAAGQGAKQIGKAAASSAGSPLAGILSRELHYAQNRIGPTKVPEIDALMHLWWTGRISATGIERGLNNQGVKWRRDGPLSDLFAQMWRQLMESERPVHPLGDYRKWFRQGRLSDDEMKAALEREGFGGDLSAHPNYADNSRQGELYRGDYETLEEGIVLELWRRSEITLREAQDALKVAGRRQIDANLLLHSLDQAPALGEVLTLLNRGDISEAGADLYLRWLGFRTQAERQKLLSLRFSIPPPSDLVRYALREAWDPDVVERFQYDAEFPPELSFWMAKQGADADARTDAQKAAGLPVVKWPQLDWRVHWQNISPQMAFEMYHRLRPERLAHFGNAFPGLRPFTFEDMQKVLKVNDYPLPFRPQLAAVNSTVLTRVDIRRLYDLEIIDRAEVKAQYLDRGYVEQDAEAITVYTEKQRRISRAGKFTRRTKAQVIDAYNVGILTRTAAAIALYELQFVDPADLARFRARPQGDRESLALGDQAVRFELTNTDAERALANGKTMVKTIHKLFVTGAIHEAGAQQRLQQVGIAGPRVAEYMLLWNLERFGPRKLLTTKQIQTAVAHGILPVQVAQFRLSNLGYSPYDQNVILAEARRSIALEQAKAQQAAAKTLQQQQRAQQAQLKALQAERRKTQNELARYATPKQLVDWYALDYLDGRTLQTRLAAIIGEPDKVSWWIDQARDARQKRLDKLGATT